MLRVWVFFRAARPVRMEEVVVRAVRAEEMDREKSCFQTGRGAHGGSKLFSSVHF